MNTTALGYPRIGAGRELKKATEAFWAGRIPAAEPERTGADLRRLTWQTLREAGLSGTASNTFLVRPRAGQGRAGECRAGQGSLTWPGWMRISPWPEARTASRRLS